MPEGHTIHRHARLQTRRFSGEVLRVWSPQGRFAAEASLLDGRVLERVDALGKHLLYRWHGAPTVHVHLGLFGRFRTGRDVQPSPNARLAWASKEAVLALSGPTVCELFDPDEEADLRKRIGPDPLAPNAGDADRFAETLERRPSPIGAVLLDQSVLAGVGNVYRAEILFLVGIDPFRPAKSLGPGEVERIWQVTVAELEAGERSGRIVTRDPGDLGLSHRREVPRGERRYVYGRGGTPCRRCGETILSRPLAGRPISWCGRCQG